LRKLSGRTVARGGVGAFCASLVVVAAAVPEAQAACVAAAASFIVMSGAWRLAAHFGLLRVTPALGATSVVAVAGASFVVVVAVNSSDLRWLAGRGDSCGTVQGDGQGSEARAAGECFATAFRSCRHRSLQIEGGGNGSGAFRADLSIAQGSSGCQIGMRYEYLDLAESHEVECHGMDVTPDAARLTNCDDVEPVTSIALG
jgi:hypothetical protein